METLTAWEAEIHGFDLGWLKWPVTPRVAQIESSSFRKDRVRLGWSPRELPQR